MRDVQEVQDLRPAPRTTPTGVLWAMFMLVICGVAVLVWPGRADTPTQVATDATTSLHAAPDPGRASQAGPRPRR